MADMAGPHPAVAAARVAVRSSLGSLPADARVIVACSGGADSLALVAATAFVAARAKMTAGAVVVDHGLQTGSAAVAARAAAQCRELGMQAEVTRVDVEIAGDGPEAAARSARYAALTRVREAIGADAILLGHTLDDQAESVLLGLARGSGARSLAGMAARRGSLLRPFLGLRRTQTEAVCCALGLDFWQDPTNGPVRPAGSSDPGREPGVEPALPLRSQVRVRAVPALVDVLGPGVIPALARTADLLREDADLLDALAADLVGRARTADAEPVVGTLDPDRSIVVVDVAVLAEAPAALRRRALRMAAIEVGCPRGDLFAVHIDALDSLVTRWRGQGPVSLPGARSGHRSYGRLFLRPPSP